MSRNRCAALAGVAVVLLSGHAIGDAGSPAWAGGTGLRDVHPTLRPSLVAYYDFDHPPAGDLTSERDLGRSGTTITLVNGGAAMRVSEQAYPGSRQAVQTRQVDPGTAGNDDWKAGTYAPGGAASLRAFNAVAGTTVMGWFKMRMDGPALNSNTSAPADVYNAIGLAGVLTGDSNGHDVRALLEVITVAGELRLVALGRRLDGGASQTFAAEDDWRTLLPNGVWVHLAATFDFDAGSMALYRNGRQVGGTYTRTDDPWLVTGPGPHVTTASDPRGIKIGGSFPANEREQNPCECRMDGLMFLDRSLSAGDVERQYRHLADRR
jgi:hypothetical protein